MGFQVDPGALDGLASKLRSGSSAIEDLGDSVPPAPDAGELSGEMGRLMGLFVAAAGELSTGVAAAAESVAQGGRMYIDADDAARQGFQGTGR